MKSEDVTITLDPMSHSDELVALAMQSRRGVFARLIAAREEFQRLPIKKSGHNKFAGYSYFELGDFLPTIQQVFNKWGLVDVISFTPEMATMTVYDVIDGSSVTFTSPMADAQLKGCHPIQNLGAVETYQRRYLYVTAMAIVEHDALESVTGSPQGQPTGEVIQPVPFKKKPTSGGTVIGHTESKLFVEGLIELAQASTGLTDLANLWKQNQGRIDQIKGTEPDLFKALQKAFAEIKKQLSETIGATDE
jgi:hypothetical protein